MLIAVDLDEVLADFMTAFLAFYNHHYKQSLRYEDCNHYYLQDLVGFTQEEELAFVYEFFKTDYFKNIQPIPGSQEAMGKLSNDHKLIILTSRQDDIKEETEAWINRFFPGIFSEIHLTNGFPKDGKPRKKSTVIRELKVDILIEDQAHYANECASEHSKCIILTRPWNAHKDLNEHVFRVHSWKEARDKIKELHSNWNA